jgi:hypothetical protein
MCLTEFTVQADFTVQSAGLSVNSTGWRFHCSNFESNGFQPDFTKFYQIRPIFLKTGRIRRSQFFSLHRFFSCILHAARIPASASLPLQERWGGYLFFFSTHRSLFQPIFLRSASFLLGDVDSCAISPISLVMSGPSAIDYKRAVGCTWVLRLLRAIDYWGTRSISLLK